MASPLPPRDHGVSWLVSSSSEPLASTVVGVVLSFSASSILACFLTQKSLTVTSWRSLPLLTWLVLAIYIDSWIFVAATAVISYGVGVDSSPGVCSAAIFLCLFFYVTTKIVRRTTILTSKRYYELTFLSFIIRGGTKRRLESKLYIFNSFGLLTVYVVVCILNFVYRIARMNHRQCIIGMEKQGLVPLIAFDILANIYLTILFLTPLQNIYTAKGLNRWPPKPLRIRAAATRTFVGALCTTALSVVNLTVLAVLDGEPGWVFLMCCNADILFSAIVIQWVTSRDTSSASASASPLPTSAAPPSSSAPSTASKHHSYHHPPRPPRQRRRRNQKLTISLPLNATSTSQYEHVFGEISPGPGETHPQPPGQKQKQSKAGVSAGGAAQGKDKDKDKDKATDKDKDAYSYFDFDSDDIILAPSVPSPAKSAKGDTPKHTHDGNPGAMSNRSAEAQQAPASTSTTSRSPSVSAAVAADLDRIRRYRERQSRRAGLSASHADRYRISTLVFEDRDEREEGEGDQRWRELVGGGSERGPPGWI
ncbi:hypothetical protein F4819DRAFT_490213 [Hypoxylon fuscum]|nr:hypothetical protein F4819DRAFT_490213 [Hypoxylon fuscum]